MARTTTANRIAATRYVTDPLTLGSCIFVGDPNLETAGSLATLTDRSTGGHSMTQATGAKRGTVVASVINGNSVLRFDTSGTQFYNVAFTLPQPTTVLLVYKQTAWSGAGAKDIVFDGGTAGSNFLLASTGLNQAFYWNASVGIDHRVAWNAFACLLVEFNGAASIARENGVSLLAANPGAAASGGITLGALADGTRGVGMDVAYYAVFNAALTQPQYLGVEGYCKSRFNL